MEKQITAPTGAPVQVTEIIEVTPEIKKLLSVLKRIDRLETPDRVMLINTFAKIKPFLRLGLEIDSQWIADDFISIISELPMMKKRAKSIKK